MPWQQHVADVTGELDDEGHLWYPETRLLVPRQSGKTQLILTRQVDRMLNGKQRGWGVRPLGVFTAQTQALAREKLVEEWHPIIEGSELNEVLLPGKQGFVRSNGREQFRWVGGGRMITSAPTATGGHSLTCDVVDYDEAFAAKDARVEQGLGPTQITRPSPQFNVTSTAGGSAADSPYLWEKVEDGRARVEAGVDSRVAYFEWAPEEDADPDAPDTWVSCSPAIGHTIDVRRIAIQNDKLSADEFARAYLNRWTGSLARIFPALQWNAARDPQSTIVGRLWMAVDVSPSPSGSRTAAISIGGYRADGRIHVEIVEHAAGTSWVADRVGALTRKWSVDRLYLDPFGPVGAILHDIKDKANVNIEEVDARTMIAACASFHQGLLDGSVRHLGQPELDAAAEGAAKRQVLDSWALARRTSSSDICPLVASVLVHWGATVNKDRGLIKMAV